MSERRALTRGFTLLEMLVATALVAVLAGSLYASLSIAFKARRSALAALEPVRRAEIAMALVAADIRSAVIPNGVLAQPFMGEDGTDTRGHDADALVFCGTAPSPEPAEGVGDVKKIEISCEASDDGQTQVLVRRVTTNLLSPRTLEPPVEVLCRGVFAFNIRYFDGSDWLDVWDSTVLENTLPLALEVTLQLDDPRQIDPNRSGYSVSQVVLVPCGALPPDSTTQGTGSPP
ncbi:MAG: prepilin-type N-terminal cleavage/methylation domain-containing protein [Planctomycetota bacterium]|nr:prepilin-type N-terminal cleavage/methylation domain-containing protein [Planctomycetota bacterium]